MRLRFFCGAALLGPVFATLLHSAAGGAEVMTRAHDQSAFEPMPYGVALAIVLTFILRETGTAVRPSWAAQDAP